ncbi:MAG TPA: prepilin-type N-terminal cleavage/methylation domain-containing protein [Opitutaceae bacterium]|nr:prepilin-type N-terminal cleavage/methylation domain-containing protein [Opitutaceae bacterium]
MWASSPTHPVRARGLTLVEVMVAVTLLGLLITAVLSAFIFILRGERSLANYTTMNAEARGMLELLGRDAKSAVAVTNFTSTSLTLVVPLDTAGGTTEVTYEFDAATDSLVRETGGTTTTLVEDVSEFAFRYLNSNNATTTSLVELKQVQLSLRIMRSVTRAATSQYVISAQYTLRAKPTSH